MSYTQKQKKAGTDDENRWIISDNERQSSETATSVPALKAPMTPSSSTPSSIDADVQIATAATRKTKTLPAPTTLRPSQLLSAPNDVDTPANGALNINLASISNNNNKNKSNHHNLYGGNESLQPYQQRQQQQNQQQQPGQITLTSIGDETKPNANTAEYYQYFTDDSVKGRLEVPHFAEKSWMAFPVLRGAYKYVQVYYFFFYRNRENSLFHSNQIIIIIIRAMMIQHTSIHFNAIECVRIILLLYDSEMYIYRYMYTLFIIIYYNVFCGMENFDRF